MMRARAGFTRARALLVGLATILVLVASGLVAYRVFAPAEVLTPARAGYPAPATAAPGVLGTLNAAPLIVDGRLRVYATTRQVRAEWPVDARTRRTPFWSYRRWPAELVGVVVTGKTVVSRWSDGDLVALDATTGRIVWRSAGPAPAPDEGYAGRRTGASTVYAPPGLYPATAVDGSPVLVVATATGRRGYDAATGRELWRDGRDGRCSLAAFTTATGQLVSVDRCDRPGTVEFQDVATGSEAGSWRPEDAGPELELAPVGCGVARSGCAAMRTRGDGGSRGWLLAPAAGRSPVGPTAGPASPASIPAPAPPAPVPAPALDSPESDLVDGVAVTPDGSGAVGRAAGTGAELWRWEAAGAAPRLLAVQSGRVHLRTGSGELVTLDAASGREMSRFPFTYGRDSTTWSPGFAYAAEGFLAVERLTEPVEPAADDGRYYLALQPVILAAT